LRLSFHLSCLTRTPVIGVTIRLPFVLCARKHRTKYVSLQQILKHKISNAHTHGHYSLDDVARMRLEWEMRVCLCVVWVFFYYARSSVDESSIQQRSHSYVGYLRRKCSFARTRAEVSDRNWRRNDEAFGVIRKKDPPAGGGAFRRLQRGWNRKRMRDRGCARERKKSQGWNGAGRRPLIKIPWHIAVCYTTTIYACSVYYLRDTHAQPPATSVYPQFTCVCACVWRAKTHWPNLRSLSIDRHNNIIIYVCSDGSTRTCRRIGIKSM